MICPCLSRIIIGSASKAEKVLKFIKPKFPKKAPGKFLKKYISGITKVSAFEWHASPVLTPPTPSNEPCPRRSGGRPGWRATHAAWRRWWHLLKPGSGTRATTSSLVHSNPISFIPWFRNGQNCPKDPYPNQTKQKTIKQMNNQAIISVTPFT